jgi:type IV pilus assembly protein PilE
MQTPERKFNFYRATYRAAAMGFTLVELMVTIVIATILITIAVPSYTSQMRQSRRTDARTALLDLAQREERYMSLNSSYSATPSQLGYTGTTFPVTTGSNYYQLNVCVSTAAFATTATCAASSASATTGTYFLITATPVSPGPQAADTQCASLSVSNVGYQSSAPGTTCWTN